ncbi:MAG TPA: ABC transporter permease [Myxococcaceae bacterium]|nr:ABC transporter permease [Myxococcaceae bacterium]
MSFKVDAGENARIAIQALRANRMRTVLTTVGIGIGVATLLAIVGVIQGLNASFAEQLNKLGANGLYVSRSPSIVIGDWWKYRNRPDLTPEHAEALRPLLTRAELVVPSTSTRGDVTREGNELTSISITGTEEGYLLSRGYTMAAGRFLTAGEAQSNQRVTVLGADAASGLFPVGSAVGQTVKIEGQSYRVVGVLAAKGKVLTENPDLVAVIPMGVFRQQFGTFRSIQIGVIAKEGVSLDSLEDEVLGAMRRVRRLDPTEDENFNINRPEMLAKTYDQLTGALFAVAGGIGFITLLVGGIGIMNIMLVSVRERTREIGIRRALGARRRTIVIQFLFESAAVSAFGGFLGAVVGLGSVRIVAEISPLAAVVDPMVLIGGIVFSGLVGLIFGIWPAARAANLDPIEALRHE